MDDRLDPKTEPKGCSVILLRRPRGCILAVAVVTALVQLAAILDAGLWVQPDSVGYVTLGQWLVERHDFSHELFAGRTPGYPLFLAIVFSVAGLSAGPVILILQHGMVVAVAVLTALMGWELTGRRAVAAVGGMAAGCAWSLTAYASTLLTETPYTLAVTGGAYLLVVHFRRGSLRALAGASVCIGIAALTRPIGLPLLGVCLLCGLYRSYLNWRASGGRVHTPLRPARFTRLALPILAAVFPCAGLAGAWSLHNRLTHGVDGAANFGGQSLYLRVVQREGLVEPTNPALEEIKRCVDEVNRGRSDRQRFSYRKYDHALIAYRLVHGCTCQQANARLGAAAWPICKAHKCKIAKGTILNAARILLMPDPVYLYRPPGSGVLIADVTHDIPFQSTGPLFDDFHTRMYGSAQQGVVGVTGQPGSLEPAWSAVAAWYHRHLVKGRSLPFLPGDSPYEHWVMFCFLGALAAATMSTTRRSGWLVLGGIVVLQVLPSGFMPGATPRFAVPVRPIVDLCGVWFAVEMLAFVKVHGLSRLHRARHAASMRTAKTQSAPSKCR